MAEVDIVEDGATVGAAVGDTVVVRLPEIGGTGYQWEVVEVPDVLEIRSSVFTMPDGTRPGAAGVREILLLARAPGRGMLVVWSRRAWEPEPVDRFTAIVVVGG